MEMGSVGMEGGGMPGDAEFDGVPIEDAEPMETAEEEFEAVGPDDEEAGADVPVLAYVPLNCACMAAIVSLTLFVPN